MADEEGEARRRALAGAGADHSAGPAGIETSRQLLRHPPFAYYWFARIFTSVAFAAQGVAVGWHLYALTGSALDLGLLGLVQFLPTVVLTLAVGHVADRYDRRMIAGVCQVIQGLAAAALAAGTVMGWLDRGTIFALVAVSASARAFEWPTMAALLPSLVQRGMLPVATAWATTANQLAQIGGPALGGFLYALTPGGAFATPSVLFICAALLTSRIPGAAPVRPVASATLTSLFSGFAFISLAAPAAGRPVARPVRGPIRRRGGAAADLCARHPADGTVGPGPVARHAGAGCAGHVGGAGALSAHA